MQEPATKAAEREPGDRDGREPHEPYELTIVAHDIGPVGGMERIISELIFGLRRRGHRVRVIARTCELPADTGVEFHRVRGPGRPFVLAYPLFLVMGTIALWRHRLGLVQTTGAIVLNRVDFVEIQYCQHVGPSAPSRESPLFWLNAAAAALLGRVGERLCFARNRPWRFICASEGVAEEMREHFPAQAARVVAVANGVDVEVFRPARPGEDRAAPRADLDLQGEQPLAIFVGSDWKRKGLGAAIRALAFAPRWQLLVVGRGDRDLYEGLARELGVAARVRFAGVSRDTAPLYRLADAFVFPTSYEAFPLVALEAAASGLPILAPPVNGVRELVGDGENGFLIDREDPAAIGERLEELAADSELARRLSQQARRRGLDYSWDRMVARHDELYVAGASRRR
ncbi:MAG TPA: glycosyltransferase family 4 protein [Solirubrobacteraceae bacterium]|nr:glycosyltransferase family 4 protein [Solirubrobacteraceae bacterium]